MEEPEKGFPASEDRSQKTAAALRALREGLGSKLETHRRRISDMDADLASRVLQIADELARNETAAVPAGVKAEGNPRSIHDLLAEREATIAKLQRQLSDAELLQLRLSAELADSRSAMGAAKSQDCASCDTLRGELTHAKENIIGLEARVDELLNAVNHAQEELTEFREGSSAECAQLQAELAQVREAEQNLREQHNADNAAQIKAQLTIAQAQQELSDRTAELATLGERESQATARIEELLKQIESLTDELTESRDAQAQLVAQTIESDAEHELQVNAQINELLARIGTLEQELEKSRQAEAQLAHDQTEKDAALAESQRSLEERTAEVASLTEREAAFNSRIETLMAQVESLTADLTAAREVESKLLAQHSATDAALAESQDAAADTHRLLQESKEQLAALTDSEAQAKARIDELAAQVESLTNELTAAKDELAARAESATNEVSWLQKEREAAEQSRDQLAADLEELLKQQKTTEEALAEAQSQHEQAAQALQEAEERIGKLTGSAEEELAQANKKFELALADAQKLKRENAELQEELARRPEVAETESAELVSLRLERDALAARITELEAAPASLGNEDSDERFADLQRRFELAVEDLRSLKQENAQLQDKLAQGQQPSGSTAASSQAMDWQAQKARLLAELESEETDEPPSPERQQELVTIEGTISITDRVVAEKDREIAELREQLTARPVEVVEKPPAMELLDKDEIIAAERAKLEALQQEWHEKLRGAELEMSVQRAALARKEAEIEQKLQAVQEAQSDPVTGADGKPRRRWLSALGLRDDEEKK